MRSRLLATSTALAASAATLLIAAPAQAESLGTTCRGTEVKRCLSVFWNRDTDRYYAKAWVFDVSGGRNYSVAVNDLRLQRFDGSYHTVRSNSDYDGYQGTRDDARTSEYDPCNNPTNSFQALATFYWRGATEGKESFRSGSVGHSC